MPDRGDKAETRTIRRGAIAAGPLPILVSVVGKPTLAVRVDSGTATIGAASGCDLVIEDQAVSRRHVEIELVPEGVLVRDLGSRNGTFYLEQRVERIILSPGSLVRIGGTTLALTLAPDALGNDGALAGSGFRGMIGGSEPMQRLFASIVRLDGSLVPAMVLGETGTGKELVARAIHEGSRVSDGPFIAMNCGALARELVASTLFGHRKGAFTGATEARRGAFATAEGGTLFLDEIGELPIDLQPALLRALETGEIVPVGEDQPYKANVRIVVATNRDLREEVRANRFREDLFYRIAVIALTVPSLRERAVDVPMLAESFARQEGAPGLPRDVLEELARRPYPGNVRELRNAVRAFCALGVLDAGPGAPSRPASASGGSASLDAALAEMVRLDVPFLEQREAVAERFSAVYIDRVMSETHGNQTAAAKIAGLDRTYFGRLLAKLGRR